VVEQKPVLEQSAEVAEIAEVVSAKAEAVEVVAAEVVVAESVPAAVSEPDEVPVVVASEPPAVVEPVVDHVESAPEVSLEERPADLGGLVMVTTSRVAVAVEPMVDVPTGPRRRDVARQASTVEAAALVQVETRH